MTSHYDQLSVAPDPARAEELRQRLHARLEGGHRNASVSITPADTDPDDGEGDLLMLETEDRPKGDVPMTPRRSPGRWLLVAAAVAVVAVVGALLVAAAGDDDETQVPATETPTSAPAPARDMLDVPGFSALPLGRYWIDPDGDDATPLRVTYEIADHGWSQWLGAVKFSDVGHAGVSITTVPNVVRDGCSDVSLQNPPVGPTVDDLATALSQLAPFEVTEPPTAVTAFGYSGKRLVLKVPDGLPLTGTGDEVGFANCVNGNLHSYDMPNNGEPFFGYTPTETEELWILDVEGTRLLLAVGTSAGTSAQDIAERDAIFDSIRIEP